MGYTRISYNNNVILLTLTIEFINLLWYKEILKVLILFNLKVLVQGRIFDKFYLC